MPQEEIDLLREILDDFHQENLSDESKLAQLGPLLRLCDPDLTEEGFWKWCRIAHIQDRELAARFLNKLHYGGIINITEALPDEDTLLDPFSIDSLEAGQDETLKELCDTLEKDAEKFRKMLRLNMN